MSLPKELVGRDGKIIWDRKSNALPDPGALVREIRSPDGVADLTLLRQCVMVVLAHAHPSSLPTWCSWLCCLGEPETTLRSLREASGGSRVCGYVFKRGDIAWNCRKCQVDSTCVQCDACFRRSDHTGHPVYFHRTAPGGCCDCGDEEAWAEEGCCSRHRARREDQGGAGAGDPLAALPPDFQAVARIVVRGVVLFLAGVCWSSLDTYDPASQEPTAPAPGASDSGNGGTRRRSGPSLSSPVDNTSSAAATPAGGGGGSMFFGNSGGAGGGGGRGSGAGRAEETVIVRVHNDDVHTFEYVIGTFTDLGISYHNAVALTQEVDDNGMANVLRTSRARALRTLRFLRERQLLPSIC
ncbi:unnamed protein product, partial [Ectocarpus sp. 13 AM-2016]